MPGKNDKPGKHDKTGLTIDTNQQYLTPGQQLVKDCEECYDVTTKFKDDIKMQLIYNFLCTDQKVKFRNYFSIFPVLVKEFPEVWKVVQPRRNFDVKNSSMRSVVHAFKKHLIGSDCDENYLLEKQDRENGLDIQRAEDILVNLNEFTLFLKRVEDLTSQAEQLHGFKLSHATKEIIAAQTARITETPRRNTGRNRFFGDDGKGGFRRKSRKSRKSRKQRKNRRTRK